MSYTPDATLVTQPADTGVLAATAAAEFRTIKIYLRDIVIAGLALKAPITNAALVTPALGTPTSGNFSTGTFTWPTFNQNTTGNAATATVAAAVPYSGLTGTVPTWNQNTTGNAATVTGLTVATGKTLTANDNVTLGTGGLVLGNSGGLTAAASKVLTVSNSLTLAGTDATTHTFPTTSATIARTDAANTFTGVQTMTSPALTTPAITGIATGTGVATAATANTLVMRGAAGEITGGAITGTTGSFTGNVTGNNSATSINYFSRGNAGNTIYFGVENSAGGGLITGDTAYDGVFMSVMPISFSCNSGTTQQMRLTSTGLNSTVIGATTPAAGSFTTLSAEAITSNGGTNTVPRAFISSATPDADRADLLNAYNTASNNGLRVGTASASGGVILQAVQYSASANKLPLQLNPDGGQVTVGSGGLAVTGALSATGLLDLSAATSGQIQFPATQNASSNANTLDDYEEGTWTPSFISTGLTITLYTQNGKYTKVGNIVNASFYLNVSGTSGTLTNNLVLQGLPFASIGGTEYGFSCAIGVQQFTLTPSIFLGAGVTAMNIYQNGTVASLTGAALATGFYLGTITYQTT